MKLAVTFPSSVKLSPVKLNELQEYCWETLKALDLLAKSAEGIDGVDLWAEGTEWTASDQQIKYLQSTPLYTYLSAFYYFSEQGISTELNEFTLEDALSELAQWLCATSAYNEFNGSSGWIGEKVIHKFLARLKLDCEWDLANKFCCVESGWYPDIHNKHLTIKELALLAGVNNIRSVRNATYDKESPLQTINEGRAVLITVPEAQKWLQTKKGFTPSKGADHGILN